MGALVESYGQVIVDECHHVGAASFDANLRRAKAKHVIGPNGDHRQRDHRRLPARPQSAGAAPRLLDHWAGRHAGHDGIQSAVKPSDFP